MNYKQQTSIYSDGMTLLDILIILWQQKWLILSITLMCSVMSVIYLYTSKPVYETKANVIAPTINDIEALNKGRGYSKNSPLKIITINNVYQLVTEILLSESIKREFFDKVYLPSLSLTDKQLSTLSKDKLYKKFLKTVLIKRVSDSDSVERFNRYTVTAYNSNPLIAQQWVKKYISLVNQRSTAEMINTVQNENASYLQNLKQQIDAEIKIMAYRKKSASSTIRLLKLETLFNIHDKIHISDDSFKMFRLDSEINLPDFPIAPNRLFILMFALIGGLMLGTTVSLLRGSFSRANLVKSTRVDNFSL